MMTETSVTVIPDQNAGARQPPTIKTEPGQPGVFAKTGFAINVPYFGTIPGILKIVQLLIGIICMICLSPAGGGPTHFFLTVVSIAFIATILWSFVYLFSIREALNLPVNWILSELLNTFIVALFYTFGFIAQLSYWGGYSGVGRYIAGGVFGIFNTIAYAAGTYFLWVEWQNTNRQ